MCRARRAIKPAAVVPPRAAAIAAARTALEDVDAAEALDRARGQLPHLLLRADVGGEGESLGPAGPAFGGDPLEVTGAVRR